MARLTADDQRVNNHHSNGSGTLEQQIAHALTDPAITVADLAALITNAEHGLIDATTIADRMQEIVTDPIAAPDATKAAEAASFAQLVVRRLENVLPRLRSKHQQVAAQQRRARWNALADATQANRDVLVAELTEVYPQWINKIIELFERIRVINQEIEQTNGLAPSSESRRLLPIDALAANSKLLDLSGQPIWPPPPAPINVNTIVPHMPAGGDWHETIARRDAERKQQSAKAAQFYHEQARVREEREAAEAKAARQRNGAAP